MRKAWLFAVLFVLCITLIVPGTAWAAQKGKGTKRHDLGTYNAILIGIGEYDSFPSLATPVADVEALAELLKNDYGFDDVTVLSTERGAKPTSSNILKVIRDKAERLGERDNLLVYYAGHGYLDKLTKKGYWIPVDGRVGDVSTWIKHEDITDVMGSEEVKIKSFILIADSCYSGNMMRSISIDPPNAQLDEDTLLRRVLENGEKKSRVIVSSGGNEPVPDTAFGTNHSLFAHYLIKGLKENRERYMDVGLLLDNKIRPEVERRIKQTPRMSRLTSAVDENGMFVLTKIGVAERPPKADTKAQMDKLAQDNAALRKQIETLLSGQEKDKRRYEGQLADLKAKQEGLNQDLSKLHETNRSNKAQIEKLRQSQEAERRQYQAELSELKAKQSNLNSDLSRLDEMERKNKADEARLQALLKEKDALSTEKLAEMEQERERIAGLNRRIEGERKGLQEREQSLAQAEEGLRRAESEMNSKIRDEEQKISALKSKEREIEARAEEAERARQRIEEEARAAEASKKRMEEETRAAELKKLVLEKQIREAQARFAAMEVEAKAKAATAGIYSGARDGDAKGRFVVLGDVVFDKETNLMWLKDANAGNRGRDLEDAEKYASELTVAGYSDWRLPSKEEWRSLIPEHVRGIDTSLPDHPFRNVVISGQYWVASTLLGSAGINLGHGGITRLNKKNPGYVWPVRYATPEEIVKIKSQARDN